MFILLLLSLSTYSITGFRIPNPDHDLITHFSKLTSSSSWQPFDGTLGTLAHAFSPPNGRFHLDGAEDWIVDGDVSTTTIRSAVDLESVAVHEIGHLLGLGHSSVEESIMYPTISSRKKKVVLRDDDIQGIKVLYGGNPNYNGTSLIPSSTTTQSHQEREESSNGGVQNLNIRSYW
ncbi:hypothetical protein MKX03_012230 [Papaver bracteatum]|nr:hypothetical protein MKX03_012230 [Papaver bracteatum]